MLMVDFFIYIEDVSLVLMAKVYCVWDSVLGIILFTLAQFVNGVRDLRAKHTDLLQRPDVILFNLRLDWSRAKRKFPVVATFFLLIWHPEGSLKLAAILIDLADINTVWYSSKRDKVWHQISNVIMTLSIRL